MRTPPTCVFPCCDFLISKRFSFEFNYLRININTADVLPLTGSSNAPLLEIRQKAAVPSPSILLDKFLSTFVFYGPGNVFLEREVISYLVALLQLAVMLLKASSG